MRIERPCVLIADDDATLRATLSRAFSQCGWTPLLAGDGAEAVEMARQQEVHIVITDLQMPRLSGLSAVRRIRERQPDLPCILMTDAISDEVQTRAQDANMFAVIPKPLHLGQVLETIQTALQRAYDWRACAKPH